MKMKPKSFPKLQIILPFFLFFLFSCQEEKTSTINKEQFIEIYTRVLIINEMKIKKSFRDSLLQEMYSEENITTADIDSSISYFNSNPREWVEIYNRVRERMQDIKNKIKEKSSKKIDSLLSAPRSSPSKKSYRKSFFGDKKKKELLEEKQKKSEEKIKSESE